MKKLMMVAALAVVQSGCVASQEDAPLSFTNALALAGAPGGSCDVDSATFIGQGSLDLAGGGNYRLSMRVESNIPVARTVIIGDTPTTVGGGDVTLAEFVYRYESSEDLGLPEEERTATYAVVPAGTSGDSYVSMYAFGPEAIEALRGSVTSGSRVSVITHIKARGHLSSTSSVESNEFSFPVVVFSSPGCAPQRANAGVCNPGQDVPTACASVTPTP